MRVLAHQATADLCDQDTAVHAIPLPWRHYGGHRSLCGPALTLSCPGSVGLVRETLAQPGAGAALLVDGAGAMGCALLGDRLAQLAVTNGWAGVIVHGAVRDIAVLATLPIAVMALGTCPQRGKMERFGQANVALNLAGVIVEPGACIVADEDGVVVLPTGVWMQVGP